MGAARESNNRRQSRSVSDRSSLKDTSSGGSRSLAVRTTAAGQAWHKPGTEYRVHFNVEYNAMWRARKLLVKYGLHLLMGDSISYQIDGESSSTEQIKCRPS